MGLQAVIVLYPVSPIPGSTKGHRSASLSAILEALFEAGLLEKAAVSGFCLDDEPTFCTSEHLDEGLDPIPGLEHAHCAIDSASLRPAISNLVYSEPASVWLEDEDPETRDLIAVPEVDVSVLSMPMPFHDGFSGDLVFESNALIEFSYGDARVSLEIHKVRDEKSVLFSLLKKSFGCDFGWAVVTG